MPIKQKCIYLYVCRYAQFRVLWGNIYRILNVTPHCGATNTSINHEGGMHRDRHKDRQTQRDTNTKTDRQTTPCFQTAADSPAAIRVSSSQQRRGFNTLSPHWELCANGRQCLELSAIIKGTLFSCRYSPFQNRNNLNKFKPPV